MCNIVAYLKKLVQSKSSERVEAAETQRKEARLELEGAIADLARARARKTSHGT